MGRKWDQIPVTEQEQRIASIKASWKKRNDFLGSKRNHPLYNIWRGIRNTNRGKIHGWDKQWDDYKIFYNDIIHIYEEGKRFCRKNSKMPFTKDNCIFLSDSEVALIHPSSTKLKYKGETKTLREWSNFLEVNYSGLRQRYYKGKNYSTEEILFGKAYVNKKKIKSHHKLEYQEKRSKASKMISQYRLSDKKKGLEFDSAINIDWFLENIFSKKCVYCGDKSKLGIDRMDSDVGHVMTNIVPCCYECNVAKNNIFSYKEMKIIGRAIKKVKASRKYNK